MGEAAEVAAVTGEGGVPEACSAEALGGGVVFSRWDMASHGREGVSRGHPAGRPGGFSTRILGARFARFPVSRGWDLEITYEEGLATSLLSPLPPC